MPIMLAVNQQTIRLVKPFVLKRREIARVEILLTSSTSTVTTIVMLLLLMMMMMIVTFELQIRRIKLFLLRRCEMVIKVVAQQRTSAFQVQIPVNRR